ncbi:MAG: VWA domain-containing protein [Clostridia bacterium]|nr:VWA domain-containing protein [Clostridia bacterium]
MSLVTFSGQIHVHTPALVKNCRDDLIQYINSISTEHGTDIGLGLEEALKTIQTLNRKENRVMLISDGFSFDNTVEAVAAARNLFDAGVPVSSICTYIPSDGNEGLTTMRNIANAGEGGKCYQISSPNQVSGIVFGSVSNDVTQSVVTTSSTVNIDMYKDAVLKGITSLPNVSKYIQSVKKYDATVPLSVNYIRPSGYSQAVPLYAYRAHGNGKVSAFTSSLTDNWCSQWSVATRQTMLSNIFESNTPLTRSETPYTVNVEYDSHKAYIEILPAVLNPDATATIVITRPDGTKMTRKLTFDSKKFSYTFDTEQTGTFTVGITYAYDEQKFTSTESMVLSYLPEYDAFANFDKSVVYKFMRGAGTITENDIPSLENDKNEIATYKRSYVIPLLIVALVLLIADIALRKLKITKKRKNGANQ